LLQESAVVPRGLQTIKSKLSRDVLRGDVAAPLSGAPALQQVTGKKTNVRPNALGVDFLHSRERRARYPPGISRRPGMFRRCLRGAHTRQNKKEEKDNP